MEQTTLSPYPEVIGEFVTIEAVLGGKSLARFGDGELKLMDGQAYVREPCPECSVGLRAELLRILREPSPGCIVGIPTMASWGPKYRNWLRHHERFAKVLNPEVTYYSAFVTRPDSAPWIFTQQYASSFQGIWLGKKVTVLCEKKSSTLKAVRLTTKATHIVCPRKKAYAQIDRLEGEIKLTDPEIVLLSCGPTATCLANRLASQGFHAVDMGSAGGFLLKLLMGGA